MKTLITMAAIAFLAFVIGCGGEYKLKVEGLDGEASSGEETGSSSSVKDCDVTDVADDDASCKNEETGSTADGETGADDTAQSGGDTDGGVEYLEQKYNNDDRYFMGTYQYEQSVYYRGMTACSQGLPLVVRAYSHDDVVDFENAKGELAWTAQLYEDETFDFEVGFLNKFGKPSLTLVCTCYIEESYYGYYDDRIKCACEPSNDTENCAIFYEKASD